MNGVIFLFALFAMASAAIHHPGCGKRPLGWREPPKDKVVGGWEANLGDWGWMVGILRFNSFICGASLVSDRAVITAAHCLYGSTNVNNYQLIIGMHDRLANEEWVITVRVTRMVLHAQYSPSTLMHDIAIMHFDPIEIDNYYIVPVCVAKPPQDWQSIKCWATGWGSLFSGGSVTRYLQEVDMLHLTNNRCSQRFGTRVNTTLQMCGGEVGEGIDTCQGDSGGPLVCEDTTTNTWYLVGITSWGFGCGDGGVYTKCQGYETWIGTNHG